MATKSSLLLMEGSQCDPPSKSSNPICPELLSTIYTAHHRHVFEICRRFFRHPEDAEDAAAEVFLKLHRVLHQRDRTLPFRPWVRKVAVHHCIDMLRQSKREKSSSVEEIDLDGFPDRTTPSPLSQILHNDEQRQIREQLIRLPEKYKVPLMLRYYKRLSYSEIARRLNTRLPAVRMLIFRAKNYLRRNLRRVQLIKTSQREAGTGPGVPLKDLVI